MPAASPQAVPDGCAHKGCVSRNKKTKKESEESSYQRILEQTSYE